MQLRFNAILALVFALILMIVETIRRYGIWGHWSAWIDDYLMGMFLNGAYQEILGDLHNLFGDTNAAHVKLDGDGYRVEHVVKGDSVTEVLRYVEYDPEHMVEAVRRQAEGAVSERRLTNEQMRMLMDHYEASLRSYTYLTED